MKKRLTKLGLAVLCTLGFLWGETVNAKGYTYPVWSEAIGSQASVVEHDATVTLYINEARISGGWRGSYVVKFKDYQHAQAVDYLKLSTYSYLVDHGAEAVIPIDGITSGGSGTFYLINSGKDPDGLHYLGPYGAPPAEPGSYIVPSFGSLNVFLTGNRGDYSRTRYFTVLLTIVDKRPYEYYPFPHNQTITYGFTSYENELIVCP